MRLYCAGPMSGYPDWNFPAFHAAASNLRAAGFAVSNPADNGVVDGWEWSDYLRLALSQMLVCDGVAVLAGRHDSRGAQLEVYLAHALGMPVHGVGYWLEGVRPLAA